jgi:signal transduction histidine kinase
MHKVTVKTCFDEDLPPLRADPMVLQRIIENLLDNATKYSPSNEVITLSAHRIGDFVEIAICDRGEGIPPEQRHLIFDRFTQLHNAASEKMRHGVGLGLAFCKLAVETMGGKIWVDSPEDGVGTAFRFQIPLYLEAEAEES